MSNYVTDAEIVALRKAASVYVFPSLKEGFSLTPLEAQAMGLPCAISDIPCHKEIYGDSVQYFDPYNVEDIAEKVNAILTDDNLKNSLRAKGLENIKKYDWKKTASITYSVFNDVLKDL
jgi:glycosyltransferase involved in cell wall biosynthesis